MNVLFFLKPKPIIVYLEYNYSMRQALEVMKNSKYTNLPVIGKDGEFLYTLSESDILFQIMKDNDFSMRRSEKIDIFDLERVKEYKTISINNNIEDLMDLAIEQNYVPVVDDRGKFIGIITRRSIIDYYAKQKK